MEDAVKALDYFVTVDYAQWHVIDQNVQFMYLDAGAHNWKHDCSFKNKRKRKKKHALTFSGDVGRYRDVILKSPDTFPQADYIIMESTYGNRLHEGSASTPDDLLEWINKTCPSKERKIDYPGF